MKLNHPIYFLGLSATPVSPSIKLTFDLPHDKVTIDYEKDYLKNSYEMFTSVLEDIPLEDTTAVQRCNYVSGLLSSALYASQETPVIMPFTLLDIGRFIVDKGAPSEPDEIIFNSMPSGALMHITRLYSKFPWLKEEVVHYFKNPLILPPRINGFNKFRYMQDQIMSADVMRDDKRPFACAEYLTEGLNNLETYNEYHRTKLEFHCIISSAPNWEKTALGRKMSGRFSRVMNDYGEPMLVHFLLLNDGTCLMMDGEYVRQGTRVDYYYWMRLYSKGKSEELLEKCITEAAL